MKCLHYNLTSGTVLSVFVHIGIGIVLYVWAFGYMKHHAIPLITELDMTTMVSAPPVGKPSKPAPTWVISKKKIQPAPQPEPEKIPVEKETDTPPAVVGGTGTWVPAAAPVLAAPEPVGRAWPSFPRARSLPGYARSSFQARAPPIG